ncbi:MAG: ATP-binding protein, partial [Gammaproteobacteria bacterium]|nr:ATP-binding protein [Gammaproteobacteria bacterium]
RGGSVRSLQAATLPRTVVSNASESPTALLARQEMRSWRLLQLEPAALRKPDEFIAPNRLGMDGSHLAKTLYHLVGAQRAKYSDETDKLAGEQQVYAQTTCRLAELQDDVHHVRVERDDKQELLTIQVAGKDGTFHPARALSDGMLRFLALAVLELDTEEGLLCLEEPENGIHPRCIDTMLDLLQDIAIDTEYPADEDNPLQQVIINTHSPSVVASVPDDSLLVAELKENIDKKTGQRFNRANFACLADTWRAEAPEKTNIVNKGDLLAYLNPVAYSSKEDVARKPHRVKYRADLQLLLPLPVIS